MWASVCEHAIFFWYSSDATAVDVVVFVVGQNHVIARVLTIQLFSAMSRVYALCVCSGSAKSPQSHIVTCMLCSARVLHNLKKYLITCVERTRSSRRFSRALLRVVRTRSAVPGADGQCARARVTEEIFERTRRSLVLLVMCAQAKWSAHAEARRTGFPHALAPDRPEFARTRCEMRGEYGYDTCCL